jgi:peptidoglycan/LPS O-acetylase OafA/YrhL
MLHAPGSTAPGFRMFGILRVFLAYLVVLSHLVGSSYVFHFGFYAVRGFFVLSGFIMTAALNEVYRFNGERFWSNRLLRLLPPYYLVCAATLAVIALVPDQAAEFLKFWRLDDRHTDVLMNFLVLPLQFREPAFRMLPSYWSIAVEIEMYVLLWLVVSRREEYAAAALGVGIVYHLACLNAGLGLGARYFTAPSALLSFSTGALVYFLRARGAFNIGPRFGAVALVAWIANMVAAGWLLPESYVFGSSYYIGTLAFAFVVAGLADQCLGARFARIDHAIGELAYPLFLVQFLCGFIVALVFFPGTQRGWELTLAATPLMLCVSFGMVKLNGMFIEPLRRRLREGAARAAPLVSGLPATGIMDNHASRAGQTRSVPAYPGERDPAGPGGAG